MEGYNLSDVQEALTQFETPFSDVQVSDKRVQSEQVYHNYESNTYMPELESPFAQTFEQLSNELSQANPAAKYYTELIGELESEAFTESLYDMATELEDNWSLKVTNEYAMGDSFGAFARKQSEAYFQPLISETYSLIDKTSEYFSGNNLADHNEASVERFFNEIAKDYRNFTPAQENFFGSFFNKIKSVVGKGIEFAKKGIAAVGKILPLNLIFDKLKGLVKPLLQKVLQWGLDKIPAALRPYAQMLGDKLFNFLGLKNETAGMGEYETNHETPATGNLEAIQTEFDHHVAQLFFSSDQNETDVNIQKYITSFEMLEREATYESGGYVTVPLDVARSQFIKELQDLRQGESPQPAIEKFLPAIISSVAKIAIGIIGRDNVIKFLSGLLSKLVGRFVPENVAMPLSTSIVDIGLGALGFELNEARQNNYAYEAISNTLEATVASLNFQNDNLVNDPNALVAEVLEAFEEAASNHFPAQYLKEAVRNGSDAGVWIMKKKQIQKRLYKKYSTIFNITIEPKQAKEIRGFNGLPLYNILKDQYGIDSDKIINARVHLFEAVQGTRLSFISRNEKIPGLINDPCSYKLIQPLTKTASNVLLKNSTLGRDFCECTRWYKTFVGQRFYYLEIQGARIIPAPTITPVNNNGTNTPPPPPKTQRRFDETQRRFDETRHVLTKPSAALTKQRAVWTKYALALYRPFCIIAAKSCP